LSLAGCKIGSNYQTTWVYLEIDSDTQRWISGGITISIITTNVQQVQDSMPDDKGATKAVTNRRDEKTESEAQRRIQRGVSIYSNTVEDGHHPPPLADQPDG
jgi:hypothetical protein